MTGRKYNMGWRLSKNPQGPDAEEALFKAILEAPHISGAPKQVGTHYYFYGEVDSDSIADMVAHLKGMEIELLKRMIEEEVDAPSPIHLHINSGGGELLAGIAGMEAIMRCRVPVYTHIDGLAASAATLLSVAGHHRTIGPHSFALIHQLSSGFWGKFEEMKDEMQNNLLLMGMLTKVYTKRTKIRKAKLESILKRDLLFDADTALQFGLVDQIV